MRTGVLAARRGQLLMGMLDLQTALLLDPLNVEAQFNLAVVYRDQGWAEMALAAFARVLDLRPDHAAAQGSLGALLAEAGRGPTRSPGGPRKTARAADDSSGGLNFGGRP